MRSVDGIVGDGVGGIFGWGSDDRRSVVAIILNVKNFRRFKIIHTVTDRHHKVRLAVIVLI
jgi:hypothetical protein